MHFSWGYLLFSMVWGLCSYVVFADYTVRLLNDTEKVLMGSPWDSDEWMTRGESANFTSCLPALCIDAGSNARSSMNRIVDIDKAQLKSADYFLVALSANTLLAAQAATATAATETVATESAGNATAGNATDGSKPRPSMILVSARDSNNGLMNFVMPPVYLDSMGTRTQWRKMSTIHPRTETLRITLLTRTVGQWKINALSVHTVTFNLLYKLLRWLVFAGWILSLVWLVLRLLSHVNLAVKAVGAVIVCLLVSVAIGGAGPAIVTKLAGVLNALRIDAGFGAGFGAGFVESLGVDKWKFSWNPALHFIAHFVLTLYFYNFRALLGLNTLRIVLLNAALAIGVECVQLGVPERSSDPGDIALAMAGVLAGIIVFQLFLQARILQTRSCAR